ncbi:hypothetical protein [Iningainema tapete]|uniref:Uncharacterized protein n=1 Tax=Iningainema tapete BLCC-T55 TaxID=2748662 RepID=A0A8J6XDD8_9CYAN|nr:hypothetical protein [Iningainema tapete]MBD2773184.1 hypothetical protein [Iningainema tapete BLCC-T55]
MTTTTLKNQNSALWEVSINVHTLTLGDWLEIAIKAEESESWAFQAWISNNASLAALSLEDWKEVTDEIELLEGSAEKLYQFYSERT